MGCLSCLVDCAFQFSNKKSGCITVWEDADCRSFFFLVYGLMKSKMLCEKLFSSTLTTSSSSPGHCLLPIFYPEKSKQRELSFF